jgi:urease accessory protein
MDDLPVSHSVIRAAEPKDRVPHDIVTLDYDQRFLRRKVLISVHDIRFLVDLSETISLEHGDCFDIGDGKLIEVIAAEEPLLVVTGDLVRLAWHIGNRHTPCQIEGERLLIRRDKVIGDMLRLLGAELTEVLEPFTPEGGAYGMGRTHGHDHSHVHKHVHSHGSHSHSHPHEDEARGPDDQDEL